jgi:hypothetical protein
VIASGIALLLSWAACRAALQQFDRTPDFAEFFPPQLRHNLCIAT